MVEGLTSAKSVSESPAFFFTVAFVENLLASSYALYVGEALTKIPHIGESHCVCFVVSMSILYQCPRGISTTSRPYNQQSGLIRMDVVQNVTKCPALDSNVCSD